jgi:hypothetical protein
MIATGFWTMRSPIAGSIMVALALAAPKASAQVIAERLVFNSLQPCRIVDTRAGGGPLSPGVPRAFHVVGDDGDFPGQGGAAGGCGVPGFLGEAQAQAVVFNFVAVRPAGVGNLRAWPSDRSAPTASVLNYAAVPGGLNIANGITVAVRQDHEGGDLTIQADGSETHLVVDVVGYYRALTQLDGVGSALDADQLQGLAPGNAAGNLAVNNGVVNTTLNADLIDGLSSSSLLRSNASDTFTGSIFGSGGTLTIANGSFLALGNGTAAAPALNFTGDTDTGLLHPFLDNISLTAGGVESLRADPFAVRITSGPLKVVTEAGPDTVIAFGDSYRDNGIVAWGRVYGNGSISKEFGVSSVVRNAPGNYTITLDAATGDFSLVPLAVAEMNTPPTSASTARLVSVAYRSFLVVTRRFDVYITDGNFVAADSAFNFIVTGR